MWILLAYCMLYCILTVWFGKINKWMSSFSRPPVVQLHFTQLKSSVRHSLPKQREKYFSLSPVKDGSFTNMHVWDKKKGHINRELNLNFCWCFKQKCCINSEVIIWPSKILLKMLSLRFTKIEKPMFSVETWMF